MHSGGPGRGLGGNQLQGGYAGSGPVGQSGSSHQPPSSMLHQSFKNPNWPPNFITPDNVLDYFCDPGNVFYDVSSCNQHVKMQNLNRPLHECLQSMQGIQFTIVGASPPLYVIMKQRRNSPNNVTPLCYYYVVNGIVYQCPDLYTFVQSKLIGVVDPLRRALEQARQFSRYNVAKGYYWEFKECASETAKAEEKEEEKPLTARSTNFQRTRTDRLLKLLFEKFPPPDNIEFDFGNNGLAETENVNEASAAGSIAGGNSSKNLSDSSNPTSHPPESNAITTQNGSQKSGAVGYTGTHSSNLTEQQSPDQSEGKRFKTS